MKVFKPIIFKSYIKTTYDEAQDESITKFNLDAASEQKIKLKEGTNQKKLSSMKMLSI
jgi:hypothetical protein